MGDLYYRAFDKPTRGKSRFSPNGLHAFFMNKMIALVNERYFGSSPWFNLEGTTRTIDDVNGRCNMGTSILSKVGYSVRDDSQTMLFDGEVWVAPRRPGDSVDGYLFSYRADFTGAVEALFCIRSPVQCIALVSLELVKSALRFYC